MIKCERSFEICISLQVPRFENGRAMSSRTWFYLGESDGLDLVIGNTSEETAKNLTLANWSHIANVT